MMADRNANTSELQKKKMSESRRKKITPIALKMQEKSVGISDDASKYPKRYLDNGKDGGCVEVTSQKGSARAGDNKTAMGVIPKDWRIYTIGKFSKVVRGGSPRPAGDPKYFNGDFIPWLTVAALTNINESELNVSETEGFLTEEGSYHSRTMPVGTVIIANSGATLGVAKILSIKCCANDGVAALFELSKEVEKRYLVYFFNSLTKKLREVIATGNGQPNLNTDLIANIQISLPPTLTEQTAIATALSDTDALIQNLEKLIAKKRSIKQGAMQELLTGKRRLPGFEGKWVFNTLNELASISKGTQLKSSEMSENGKYAHLNGGTTPSCLTDKYNTSGNTIAISEGGNSCGFVQFMLQPYWCGGHCYSVLPRNIDNLFLYYALKNQQPVIMALRVGSGLPNVQKTALLSLKITYPANSNEQTAIASILSSMDTELSALERKLSKIRSVKQGMMQELLTGKTRLVSVKERTI